MIREIEVSTTIQPYEDLNLVVDSVRSFFPDWDPDLPSRDDGFPSNNSHEIIYGFSSSLDLFLDAIRRFFRRKRASRSLFIKNFYMGFCNYAYISKYLYNITGYSKVI